MDQGNENKNVGTTDRDRVTEQGQRLETPEEIAERISRICPCRTDTDAQKRREIFIQVHHTLRDERKRYEELVGEVERLRKQLVQTAQDARYDAQAAADEAYWRDKQGDEYGSC